MNVSIMRQWHTYLGSGEPGSIHAEADALSDRQTQLVHDHVLHHRTSSQSRVTRTAVPKNALKQIYRQVGCKRAHHAIVL